METSVLNVAHAKERRAEALLREGRFEEAAECHEKVASLLEEAHEKIETNLIHLRLSSLCGRNSSCFINSFHSFVTLESLALQRDYHKRQAAVVRMKRVQYEEYKMTLENQQRDLLGKRAPKQIEKETLYDLIPDKYEGSLRQAIYKTIEEQDSLLGMIYLPESSEKLYKHPKDTGTIIEELRTVNNQLRKLVGNLINQLEAKELEVQHLTERLRTVSVSPIDEARTDSLRFPPLPPLAPLEMPLFDFASS